MRTILRTKDSGFSLTEIIVVLAAACILAAMGVPILSTAIDQYNLVLGAQGVSTQLQLARMKAITSNESLRINFPVSTRQYQMESSDGTIIKGPFFYPSSIRPNDVDTSTPITFPGRYVTFGTNGSIPTSGNGSAGRIMLINRAGMRIDIVVSSGGVIRQTPTYKEPPAPF